MPSLLDQAAQAARTRALAAKKRAEDAPPPKPPLPDAEKDAFNEDIDEMSSDLNDALNSPQLSGLTPVEFDITGDLPDAFARRTGILLSIAEDPGATIQDYQYAADTCKSIQAKTTLCKQTWAP